MASRTLRRVTIVEGSIDLERGEEWHSHIFNVQCGERLRVEAFSESRFYASVFSQDDYLVQIRPGTPFKLLHLLKRTKWLGLVRAWLSPRSVRVVFQVGGSLSRATIHFTATLLSRHPQAPSELPPRTTIVPWTDLRKIGETHGPFQIPDALEPVAVAAILTAAIAILGAVNVLLALESQLSLLLFQADAEWGVFIAALYVALRTIPDWITKRRGEQK